MNPDFLDFIAALLEQRARFLVVGAHALAVHGVPRATGDIDIWIDRTPTNTTAVWNALLDFGAPMQHLGIHEDDLRKADTVLQIGLPPRRIDILTDVSGLTFDDAWEGRVTHTIQDFAIPFLGRTAFIQNKRASGRLKDLADIEALGEPTD